MNRTEAEGAVNERNFSFVNHFESVRVPDMSLGNRLFYGGPLACALVLDMSQGCRRKVGVRPICREGGGDRDAKEPRSPKTPRLSDVHSTANNGLNSIQSQQNFHS